MNKFVLYVDEVKVKMIYNFDEIVSRINTKCYKWDAQKGTFGMEGLLPFWVADSDFKTAPEIISALQKRVEHGIYGYSSEDEEYFKASAGWLQRRHDWQTKEEWIVPMCGVVTSISFAIKAFTQPGDKILIQTPVYGPFFSVVKSDNRELVESPLKFNGTRYEMDFEDLEAKCAAGVKMIILCSPHNPSGRVWERVELETLVAICRKYDIVIVSDEIHCDLIYKGHKHLTLGSFADFQDRMVVCTAASKSFNIPGLDTSNIVIPDEKMRMNYRKAVNSCFISQPNFLGRLATQTAYDYGEKWLDAQIEYLTQNLNCLMDFFKIELPDIKVIKPEGTYLAWLDFKGLGMTNNELMKLLIEKGGIALSNGTVFGDKGEGFMRFNYACPRILMEEGLSRIKTALTT